MGKLETLAILAGIVALIILIPRIPKVAAQEITSPQRTVIGGLRSTNTLGFDFETAIANLRDNLSIGGLLFQG